MIKRLLSLFGWLVFASFGLLCRLPSTAWAGESFVQPRTLICATPQGILVNYDCPKLRKLARKFKAPNLAQIGNCPGMEKYDCIKTGAKMNVQIVGDPAPYVTISNGTIHPLKIAQIRLFTDAAGHTLAIGGSVNPYVKAGDVH